MCKRNGIQIAVALCALLAPTVAFAGVAMPDHQNGGGEMTGGRGDVDSQGVSQFVVKESNHLNRVMTVTDPTQTLDPINGFGVQDINAKSYLQNGPGQTKVVFDFLAAQTLVHVLGYDMAKPFNEVPAVNWELNFDKDVTFFGRQKSGKDNLQRPFVPPVTEVPEPASVALLGLAAAAVFARRPRHIRSVV